MLKCAILIPGSPTAAFYSQIAAISLSLRKLQWKNWTYSIHAFFGGEYNIKDHAELERWMPYLQDVTITHVSQKSFEKAGNWAQCDEVMLSAPRDANVLLALDADTLPVAGLEHMLNHVHETKSIAGVMAHLPFPGCEGAKQWNDMSQALIGKPLDFEFSYSLIMPDAPEAERKAPFYLNGGVVFYSQACFSKFVNSYFLLRKSLTKHMEAEDFSGQVAITLAIAELEIPICELPMRYNYPNDLRAQKLYPQELENVVVYHYLRTQHFNRQEIFTSRKSYENFMSLALTGPNKQFQKAVKETFGEQYPFSDLRSNESD